MLKIFFKFGKLSRSFLIFVCPLGEKNPRMSLAFMIKAYSSQDCRRIRILSIGWHLVYRDALIKAYKKRWPVPCYSPCPCQPEQQYYNPHHSGNMVNHVPVPGPVPATMSYPVYYPQVPAAPYMIIQLFLYSTASTY